MKKFLVVVTTSLALMGITANSATASTPKMVKHAHCKAYKPVDGKKYPGLAKSERKKAGTCESNGTKVYVITFKSKVQQNTWEFNLWASYLPNDVWFDHGKKFVVMGEHGSKRAAVEAVDAFGGVATNNYWEN